MCSTTGAPGTQVRAKQVGGGMDGAQRRSSSTGQVGHLHDGGDDGVEFQLLARLEVLQHGGLVVSRRSRPRAIASRSRCPGVAPTLAAMSSVSSISWIDDLPGARVFWQISTIVALVSALSGLNATLPISLIQMSLRRSASTGAFSPPAIMASLNAIQRAEISPDGSPMENRVPSRCRITPGASMVVAGYTTQPMARSGESTAVVAPPGSTASTRRPR